MDDLVRREDVLQLLYEAKESDGPKNYGTLLDIIEGVRHLQSQAVDLSCVENSLKCASFVPCEESSPFDEKGIAGSRIVLLDKAVEIVEEAFSSVSRSFERSERSEAIFGERPDRTGRDTGGRSKQAVQRSKQSAAVQRSKQSAAEPGDIVYALWSVPQDSNYVIYPCEVKEIYTGKHNGVVKQAYRLEPVSYRGRFMDFYEEELGKTFFLEMSDAEAALLVLQKMSKK